MSSTNPLGEIDVHPEKDYNDVVLLGEPDQEDRKQPTRGRHYNPPTIGSGFGPLYLSYVCRDYEFV